MESTTSKLPIFMTNYSSRSGKTKPISRQPFFHKRSPQPGSSSRSDAVSTVKRKSAGTGRKLTERVKAYIAGLFDGEGCIRYHDRCLRVTITSCYPHHLTQIMEHTGLGKIRRRRKRKPEHKTCYELAIDGSDGVEFLNLILPYLKEKRYQAEIATLIIRYPKASLTHQSLLRELKRAKRIDYS